MKLVGRPLAQRVVRRVGRAPRVGRRDAVRRGVDQLLQRPQDLGLPPGPAAVDAPDRGRHTRPRGRRGQLRRHHLRQGRLGAAPARRLGRRGAVLRRAAHLLRPRTPTATPSWPTCSGELEETSGRDLGSWTKEWLQTVRRQHCCARSSRSTPTAAFTLVRGRAGAAAARSSRPCARTGSRSASTTSTDAGLVRRTERRDRRRRAARPTVPELVGEQRPDLRARSTTTT